VDFSRNDALATAGNLGRVGTDLSVVPAAANPAVTQVAPLPEITPLKPSLFCTVPTPTVDAADNGLTMRFHAAANREASRNYPRKGSGTNRVKPLSFNSTQC